MKQFNAILLLTLFTLMGCQRMVLQSYQELSVPSEKQWLTGTDVPVYMGGYGSSIDYSPSDSTIWLLTDRGPNIDGPQPDSKVFLLPDYVPHIGIFKMCGDSLVAVRKIFLSDMEGVPFCGLPKDFGDGATGEIAFNLEGDTISSRRRGLDPEGLAIAPDGSFWISDEYGPYLMHFDSLGKLQEELSPYNGGIPQHYAQRKPNRGLESLCLSRDGFTLYTMLQAPLVGTDTLFGGYIPLLQIDLRSREVHEYAYKTESKANGANELVYINDTTLLVLERDGSFPKEGRGFKRVYQINLPQNSEPIPVVDKKLRVDILKVVPSYPHDKPEGIVLVDDTTLYLINDDDFGVTEKASVLVPKEHPDGHLDRCRLYKIEL